MYVYYNTHIHTMIHWTTLIYCKTMQFNDVLRECVECVNFVCCRRSWRCETTKMQHNLCLLVHFSLNYTTYTTFWSKICIYNMHYFKIYMDNNVNWNETTSLDWHSQSSVAHRQELELSCFVSFILLLCNRQCLVPPVSPYAWERH